MVAHSALLVSFAGLALPLAVHAAPAPAPTITQRATPVELRKRGTYAWEPLTDAKFAYSAIPSQVNPYNVGRGPQSGYNICNSGTAGPDSLCQTLIFNDIDDFCIWSSATPNSEVGDIEGEVVAWCTPKNAHGSRTIPDGTITGLQMVTTDAYIQITGFIDQTKLDLKKGDAGGKLDPHGADLLGNPLGGLVYSNSLNGATGGDDYVQVYNWNEFIGSNTFCIKLCVNSITSPNYCQNKFDLIGCDYNMPSNAVDGEFTKCESDLQMEAGLYVEDGKTLTWSQPASLADNYVMPYTPTVPASSKCTTYASSDLFGAGTILANPATTAAPSSATLTTASSSASAASNVVSSGVVSSTALSSASASASMGSSSEVIFSSQSVATAVAVASSVTPTSVSTASGSAPSASSSSVSSGVNSLQSASAAFTLAMGALVLVAGVALVA